MSAKVAKMTEELQTDICIIGGGIAGLSCAVFLRQLSPNAAVMVLERADIKAEINEDDGKSVVFDAKSAKWLKSADCWDENARKITRVRAAFGDNGDNDNNEGGKSSLDIGGEGAELGYGASHLQVRRKLAEKLQESLITPAQVQDYDNGKITYTIGKTKAKTIRTRMTIFACETPLLPPVFRACEYHYRQAALTLTATAKTPPGECAKEQFTSKGALALVPRADGKVGIVLIASSASAAAVNAMADDELSKWLDGVFGRRFGLRVVGNRAVYSPRLRHIRPLAAGREICIGAGATLLHPAGAQGLNLGIADARTFAECWRDNEMHTETGNGNTETRLAGIARTYRHRRRGAHLALITATSAMAITAKLCTAPPIAKLGAKIARLIPAIPAP